MKIAVCVKQVPARDWQPRIDETGMWIREPDAGFEMNEPDAYALEAGLRLKERHGGEVVVCAAGPARVAQLLREGLARGADRGIQVDGADLARADAFGVAGALALALREEAFDLILTGLQSDDQGFAQTGIVLAELLGRAHATIVMDVQVQGAALRVKRELEGGWFQWVSMPLPAVVTVQSGINQLRYATLKGIMAAKKKEIRVVVAPPVSASRSRIVGLRAPAKAKTTTLLTGSPTEAARQLVQRLRDDAHVV